MKKFLLLITSTFALLLSACNFGGDNGEGPYGDEREIESISARYDGEISVGNQLNIESLSVTAHYVNNSTSDVKNRCEYYIDSQKVTISSYIFNNAGDIPVTAKYEGLSANFTVKVNPNEDHSLRELYFETKQVFDHAGEYTLVLAYQFNNEPRRVSLNKVKDGLYRFYDVWGIEGEFTITATNRYGTLMNQLTATVPDTGNMLVIDTLTTSHWAAYSSNYVPVKPTSLTVSYQKTEVEQYERIDFDKVTATVTCSDNTSITFSDYKLFYKYNYNTKIYINSDSDYYFGVNVGETSTVNAEAFGLTAKFTVTIVPQVFTTTVYLNALCGFDYPDSLHKEGFGIYAFLGEEENEKMFKMEKVGNFEHVYSADVSFNSGQALIISFKVAMMYSTIAHSYLFTGYKTEKMNMSSKYNMFGVAEIDENNIAHGPLHSFDENFDYDNDVIRNVAYDKWLTSLRGNLTYRQRIYDNRQEEVYLYNDEIYYQNGEDERRIVRYDGDGNPIDNYYIRSIFNRRYMYFEEGDIRRIEDVESESWWWSASDKIRYNINLNSYYYVDGSYVLPMEGEPDNDILRYIDNPEYYMCGNIHGGDQPTFFKFENYQLKELWFIKGNDAFGYSDFSNWGTTIPEPLQISFTFRVRTNWQNILYTIYNGNDQEVANGYYDTIQQYANYQLTFSQKYDELDVFGDENQYAYVIFSTTDNCLGQAVTTEKYYLNNARWSGQSERPNDYTLGELLLSISNDGVVTECDLPYYI